MPTRNQPSVLVILGGIGTGITLLGTGIAALWFKDDLEDKGVPVGYALAIGVALSICCVALGFIRRYQWLKQSVDESEITVRADAKYEVEQARTAVQRAEAARDTANRERDDSQAELARMSAEPQAAKAHFVHSRLNAFHRRFSQLSTNPSLTQEVANEVIEELVRFVGAALGPTVAKNIPKWPKPKDTPQICMKRCATHLDPLRQRVANNEKLILASFTTKEWSAQLDAARRNCLLQAISRAITDGQLISTRIERHYAIMDSPRLEKLDEEVREWIAKVYGNLQQHSAEYAEAFGEMLGSQDGVSTSAAVQLKAGVDQKLIILASLKDRLNQSASL